MIELTCQELVELVTDYLDETLPAEDKARFDEHVADCPGCAAYLVQFTRTIELTGTLEPEDIAPPVRDALLARFRDWKRERSP